MSNETAKEWAARLKSLAGTCQFGNDELKIVSRDIFIISYKRGTVQDRLMEEKCTVTFKEIVDIAAAKSAAHATSSLNQCFIKKESELHYAQAGFRKKGKEQGHGTSPVPVKGMSQASMSGAPPSKPPKCLVCGRRNHQTD
ncbi:uncharacterized protein [Leptinotarsa decemlineata]|uniref:uncharacterized protein n=1 Tax=Leptinotarsa decemlineata TaxID=7539 RepID=UPI003D30D430